jgi:hypothetical protein
MTVELSWADLDPRTHAFDGTAVRAAIAAAVAEYAPTFGGDPLRGQIADSIDQAILDAADPWACGWRWSPGSGGGPVSGWCCGLHSVFQAGDPDPAATIDRAVDAVVEWRAFLVRLDAMFAGVLPPPLTSPCAVVDRPTAVR